MHATCIICCSFTDSALQEREEDLEVIPNFWTRTLKNITSEGQYFRLKESVLARNLHLKAASTFAEINMNKQTVQNSVSATLRLDSVGQAHFKMAGVPPKLEWERVSRRNPLCYRLVL